MFNSCQLRGPTMLPARSLFGFGVVCRVVVLVSVLSSVLFAASWPGAIPTSPKDVRTLDRFEPDDTPAQAKVIENGETQNKRSLDIVGDVDWVRFAVPEPSHVVIIAICSRGTLKVGLYERTAGQAPLDEWTADQRVSLKTLRLEPGGYYLRVANVARSGTIPDYSLSLAITPVPREVQPVQPPVAMPTFSPAPPQTFTNTMTVGIFCATDGATIRYTGNSTDPTSTSPIYSGPLTFKTTTTLKARAFKSGMTDSAVASGVYTKPPQVATPTFSPPSGTFADSVTVSIPCATPRATIRFTTDGQDPTSKSPTYGSRLMFTSTTTLKAKAFKEGMTESDVATAIYTKQPPVATPTFSPAPPQTFANTISVSISCATSGATIRYTTNGSDPTSSSPIYKAPLTFSATTTLKARAFKSSMTDSAVASGTYTLTGSGPACPICRVPASPDGIDNLHKWWRCQNAQCSHKPRFAEYTASPHQSNDFTAGLRGYCTWYTADRWLQANNAWFIPGRYPNAKEWWTSAPQERKKQVPVAGAIVVFGSSESNSAGHVGYVTAASNGNYTFAQMNAGPGAIVGANLKTQYFGLVTERTQAENAAYAGLPLLGFIHPSQQVATATPTPPMPVSVPSRKPYIVDIEPRQGPPGQRVTIVGGNLGARGEVVFGASKVLRIHSWTEDRITVDAPSDYGLGLTGAEVALTAYALLTGDMFGLLEELVPPVVQLDVDIDRDGMAKSWLKIAAALGIPGVKLIPSKAMAEVAVTVRTSAGEAVSPRNFLYTLPPVILPGSLPPGIKGKPYEAQLQAVGGTSPYGWSSSRHSDLQKMRAGILFAVENLLNPSGLPKGLTLDASTGRIAGVPTKTGKYEFTVMVYDNGKQRGSRTYLLRIDDTTAGPASDAIGTVPPPTGSVPAATTGAAGSVTANVAALTGTVNPNGLATTAQFQWGTAAAYGQTTPAQPVGGGTSNAPVSANLTGLQPDTTYHYRVTATNSKGTVAGADMSFKTQAPPPAAVTLTLYVHDGNATGPVLAGTRVVGQDGSGKAFDQTTNAGGYVTLTGAPGTWQFTASKTGYETNAWSQATSETATRHAFLQPVAPPAATPVTLTLYVHDGSATGPVLAGAQVTGQDGGGKAFDQTTNASGYVTLTGATGTWQFTASKSGWRSNSWGQAITASGTKRAFLLK